MHQSIIFATAILALVSQSIYSLTCWSTSAENVNTEENRNKTETCMVKTMDNTKYSWLVEDYLACYKLVYQKDSAEYVHKGCHLKGGCKVTIALTSLITSDDVKCFDCSGNLCNSAHNQFKVSLEITTLIAMNLLLYIF